MSYSGKNLTRLDPSSMTEMEIAELEHDLREARAWRNRIRGPEVHIRDCNKEEILTHYDQLMRAANAFHLMLKQAELLK